MTSDINIRNQLMSKTSKIITFTYLNPESSIKNISKSLDTDYNFTSKIIQKCVDEGLLKIDMVGREKRINVTPKGKDIAKKMAEIETIMGEDNGTEIGKSI